MKILILLLIGVILTAGCMESDFSFFTGQSTPIPTKPIPTKPIKAENCLNLLPGKYVSVSGFTFNNIGTPDSYATFEINADTNSGILTLPGNVFRMKITKHKGYTCGGGGWIWTAENPHNSGDIGAVRENPQTYTVYGDLYFDRLDFVNFKEVK